MKAGGTSLVLAAGSRCGSHSEPGPQQHREGKRLLGLMLRLPLVLRGRERCQSLPRL